MWFRVDDTFNSHPKARKATQAAIGLWSVCGSWSGQNLTDGYVPRWYVRTWPNGIRNAQKLVQVGLWTETVKDGVPGYQFHEWEQANPLREDVIRQRDQRSEAGRLGGARSAESRKRNQASAQTPAEANAQPDAQGAAEGVLGVCFEPRPDPNQELADASSLERGRAKPRAAPGRRGTRVPDDFAVTADMVQWATENAPNVDVRTETAKFLDYWRGRAGQGGVKLDWNATWRNWMRKAEEYTPRLRAVGNDLGSEAHFARAMARAEIRERQLGLGDQQ